MCNEKFVFLIYFGEAILALFLNIILLYKNNNSEYRK